MSEFEKNDETNEVGEVRLFIQPGRALRPMCDKHRRTPPNSLIIPSFLGAAGIAQCENKELQSERDGLWGTYLTSAFVPGY